jgi:hypothetical protein
MDFDSLSSLLLFAACVSAWLLVANARSTARMNVRFAAMLFAALGVASILGLLQPQFFPLAGAVALIGLSLGATCLALSLFALLARPLPAGAAALALVLSLGAGLGAALSGAAGYALGWAALAASLTIAAAVGSFPVGPLRAFLAVIAVLSLVAGGLALMQGAVFVTELFFAAAILAAARASQKRVESEAGTPVLAIGFRA